MNNKTNSFQLPNVPAAIEFDSEKFKTLREAYESGELVLKRSEKYRGDRAKLGYVFYWINFDKNGKSIYKGAYEIRKVVEEHLKKKDQLEAFILFELTKEL